jgi:SAM-dependent methyltransferase
MRNPHILDERITRSIKCQKCDWTSWSLSEEFLTCNHCESKFDVHGNTIILYEDQKVPKGLEYISRETKYTSLRNTINKFGFEDIARKIFHVYISLNSKLSSYSPATPVFWMKKVQRFLPESPNFVLDFGGGAGNYKKFLADSSDLYIILEVDPNSYSVKKNQGDHIYIIGDGHSPLFADNSFDVIAMFEVLEHVRNPFKIFANCSNWLKPGGRLILSVPQYWHIHGWPNDYFRFTKYGLEELANNSGLHIVEVWPMGGPCVLIWSVIELNFAFILRLPLVYQLVFFPTMMFTRIMDFLIFRNNQTSKNPDTRGWIFIAEKPKQPIP